MGRRVDAPFIGFQADAPLYENRCFVASVFGMRRVWIGFAEHQSTSALNLIQNDSDVDSCRSRFCLLCLH